MDKKYKDCMEICKIMLQCRGYSHSHNVDLGGDVWHNKSNGHSLFLFSEIMQSIHVKLIEPVVNILSILNLDHAILVYYSSASTSVVNKVAGLGLRIELVHVDRLICDITKHMYQPKMTRCTETQSKNASSLYMYAMPQIAYNDPMVLWMSWKKGDVISICPEKCINNIDDSGKCCDSCHFRRVV